MAMDRWDPFRDMMAMREAMDRWVQGGLANRAQFLQTLRPEAVPMDVVERDDAYELSAALPGVTPEDVEVTVQGERVTIRAEVRAPAEKRNENILVREFRYGTMQRSITLPSPVSSESTEARLEHGVLTLRLPKAQLTRAKRITIGSGGRADAGMPSVAHHETHGSRDHTAQGDKVTEESQESFPASDSPSWTPERT